MKSKTRRILILQGFGLPKGHITNIQDSYKYQGVPQSHRNHNEKARKADGEKKKEKNPLPEKYVFYSDLVYLTGWGFFCDFKIMMMGNGLISNK